MDKKQLVGLATQQIGKMWGAGGYYPRRMKPKWNNTKGVDNKFNLYVYYVSQTKPSIGFNKLVSNGFPEYTFEALIFQCDGVEQLLPENIKQKCADKFSRYLNGREFLKNAVIKQCQNQ